MKSILLLALFTSKRLAKKAAIPTQHLFKQAKAGILVTFAITLWMWFFGVWVIRLLTPKPVLHLYDKKFRPAVIEPIVDLVKEELEMLKTWEDRVAYVLNFVVFFGFDFGIKYFFHPQWPEKLLVSVFAFLAGHVAEWFFWNWLRPGQEKLWLRLRERFGAGLTFATVYCALEAVFPPWGPLYKLYSAIAHFSSRWVQKKLEEFKNKKRQKS